MSGPLNAETEPSVPDPLTVDTTGRWTNRLGHARDAGDAERGLRAFAALTDFREYRRRVGKTVHDLGGYRGLTEDLGPLGDRIERYISLSDHVHVEAMDLALKKVLGYNASRDRILDLWDAYLRALDTGSDSDDQPGSDTP